MYDLAEALNLRCLTESNLKPVNFPVPDGFVPDPQVRAEFGVTEMTMWRWDHDQKLIALGWPPAIRIRKRKFRQRSALDEFKQRLLEDAIEHRSQAKARAASA